jgi:hypothetical protein
MRSPHCTLVFILEADQIVLEARKLGKLIPLLTRPEHLRKYSKETSEVPPLKQRCPRVQAAHASAASRLVQPFLDPVPVKAIENRFVIAIRIHFEGR